MMRESSALITLKLMLTLTVHKLEESPQPPTVMAQSVNHQQNKDHRQMQDHQLLRCHLVDMKI